MLNSVKMCHLSHWHVLLFMLLMDSFFYSEARAKYEDEFEDQDFVCKRFNFLAALFNDMTKGIENSTLPAVSQTGW